MPTANANTGNGFSKAISYALQEAKKYPEETRAKVLELNQVYGSSKEMGKQMREVADDRKTALKPVLHVQINFHPDEKLSKAQAEQAIDSILKDIGIEKDNHQYVVVQHKDKAHDHYHVVANRVGMDGELLNDHRIKDRLQVACDKVEQEQGLRPTQGRTVMYDQSQINGFRYATAKEKQINKKQKENKPIRDKNPKIMERKTEIRDQLKKVLSKKEIDSPEKLKSELEKRGVDIQFSENKNGISGISFRKDNISVKGSAINYKWSDLSKVLEENNANNEQLKNVAPQRAKPVLAEDMEKQKDKNIFKADIPSKENFEILDIETPSAEVKKEGLQPTPEEKKEHDFIKDYNPRVESAMEEIKKELEKGNIDVKVSAIMEKHGFKEGTDRFIYSNGQMKTSIKKATFERPIKDVKEQFAWFKDSEKRYHELMQQEPKKITVLDKLTGRGKEKENANYKLQREKKDAVKPEFKPQVRGMGSRDLTLTSKFENREYEYKRQLQLKEMFSNKNEQEQSQKRGLRR
ncbi:MULTISPECIES: relaxase/mobilization nuclease domain-containing protein [Pedobacter]|uniref:MobA/VirD2-like nuclease domain-containing protein n=2 Tax=Pedobacter TaxID=84567 RepID=A0A3N0BRJ3_9SPHI|nr:MULTISPECIES: relaxase/mobilization nuclease domain-containing protein [Pedobacter]RNL51678.1 hypothetical protein D7004_14255 [Pedobacter jejuensis]GGI29444.1 hypothetical protein GCM10008119_37650 [Pedobacter mendelii]